MRKICSCKRWRERRGKETRSPFFRRLFSTGFTRDTVLVTRRDGARILIPQGTLVRVAGITQDDKALVVSQREIRMA